MKRPASAFVNCRSVTRSRFDHYCLITKTAVQVARAILVTWLFQNIRTPLCEGAFFCALSFRDSHTVRAAFAAAGVATHPTGSWCRPNKKRSLRSAFNVKSRRPSNLWSALSSSVLAFLSVDDRNYPVTALFTFVDGAQRGNSLIISVTA